MDQSTIRLLAFSCVLILMALVEHFWPRKQRNLKRNERWFNNIALSVINILVIKLLGPISAMAIAAYAYENNLGLLNVINLPLWLKITLGVVILDLAIYLQHVASHKIPILWRFHKVHHADRDIDVTTGIRFHPIESGLSMVYKCLIIIIVGPLSIAVFLFEVILNASAMFNHANVKLPLSLDSILRQILVTPDMHRVHHSAIQKETDSNYGFFLSIWDRFFKTYTPQPKLGHQDMLIGLNEYQNLNPSKLIWSLKIPFK